MRILILGGDGRSYAIGRRLRKEGHEVLFIPGNSACAWLGSVYDIPMEDIVPFVQKEISRGRLDLVVATRLDTSEAGVVDDLGDILPVYGISEEGILLESDRGYASELCRSVGINTPNYYVDTVDNVIEYVRKADKPFVVKWDDLVGGTNVSVCENVEDTIHELNTRHTEMVMVQDKLHGVEVSFTVNIGAGGKAVGVCTVFEHKRAYDNDLGPMTAEMGSFVIAGVPEAGMDLYKKLQPELAKIDYRGMLDINCMLDEETGGLWFIEFTARFGDPTAEIWIPMIDGNFGDLLYDWARGIDVKPRFKHKFGVGVVIAGGGYPFEGQVKQGLPMIVEGGVVGTDLVDLPWLNFMSAGIDMKGNAYSKGGRQVIVLGYGPSGATAIMEAYEKIDGVVLRDMYYRTDIGKKWDEREKGICYKYGLFTTHSIEEVN